MMLNKQFKFLILSVLFTLNVLGAGSYIKGPALIEGFTTITSAAGTTTLTVASETKQIVTGATTQTIVMPDATTLPLGRKFLIINKSSGNVTVNDGSGGLLVTVAGGTQAEVHLRAGGSLAGTWDVLESSAGGGGGTWGSITGTLSDQTDLQTALNAKADENNPGFAGTIGTTITASRLLVTDGSSNLAASATTATEAGYLSGVTGGIQTQLNGKVDESEFAAKGDILVGTGAGTLDNQAVGTNGQTLIADSAATKGIRYKTPLVDNFIKNGDAESTTPIVTYADAAGTRPVDGTGGSPNVTTSISSTAPLADTNSFLLTKDAVNRQGQGWSIPFTIPNSMKAKVAQIELDYIVNSGTFAAGSSSSDGDLIVYIYDVTNSTLIEPSSIKFLSSSTATSDRIVTNFQTSATGTSYNLILHVASTSASAYTLKVDNIQVKPSQYVYGTPITDWVAYTPTGSLTTNATYTGMRRRVGGDEEFRIKTAFSGTNTQGAMTLNLPVTIDTAKIPGTISGATIFGQGSARDNASADFDVVVGYNSSTSVTVLLKNSSATYAYFNQVDTSANVPMTIANGDTVEVFFKVPVVGYGSSTQQSDGYDGRQITASYTGTSGTITAGGTRFIVDAPTKVVDKTSAVTTGASWKFTALSSGTYQVNYVAGHSSVTLTTGSSLEAEVYKNGSFYAAIARHVQQAATAVTPLLSGSLLVELNAGDYIDVREAVGGAVNATISSSRIDVYKLQAPTTISATERVSAILSLPSGQALGSATVDTVIYTSKEEDTHGAYNSSTGEYRIQYGGRYDFTMLATCSARSSAAFDLAGYIYVNGVERASLNNYSGVNTVIHIFPINLTTSLVLSAGDIVTFRARAGYSGESLVANAAKNRVSILKAK